MEQINFHIINAAAGSGKTYTLVLRYLTRLLGSKSHKPYRKLLALTFTNKAVNEMKERILATLLDLSKNSPNEKNIEATLCSLLKIEPQELARRANQRLHQILFEYGSFDIITLDKFTHRIIRSFSKELQLPYGFEVVIDPSSLLEETVNSIIDEVGKEASLTQLLTDFSMDKVNQEQSWNIQKDLDDFASILLNENDRVALTDLKKKSMAEHKEDQRILLEEQRKAGNQIQKIAKDTLALIQDKGLEEKNFLRGTLPKHFQKAKEGDYLSLYKNRLERDLVEDKPLYKKDIEVTKKELIDGIRPQLLDAYLRVKKNVGIFLLTKRTLKSLTPRSLLQLMEERLESLQNEKEVRLLGEFNNKISKLVQGTNAPFIYERLGERYQHYFLDEFQDTSQLQWSNLVPLISNALESESVEGEQGSLLIVGDPKQAIYRWRGGDIQQFVDLLSQTNIPFQVKPQVENLEINYRSGKTIVEFNNDLFLTLSALFEGQEFKRIYGIGSQQKSQLEGGYVRIEALPKGGLKEENTERYVVKTIEAVDRAMELKYKANEIAVLVRKRDQASAIGAGLTQAGYSILSSESLVVGQSKKVQVVLAILKLTIQPNDPVLHKLILDALWELSPDSNVEYHTYIQTYVLLSTTSFFKELEKEFLFNFSFKKSSKSSVLEATEYIMEQFVFLLPPNDPFLNTFLEDVFEFYSTRSQTISAYLKYWERQEEKLRITTPAGMDAIHLMTIHQAKGLEFPVVILPFMDTPIHPNLKEKLWYPFKEEPLSEIQWGWITASKEIQLYGDTGQSLFDQYVLSQNQDAVNVLYVATTRAKEQLYIITQEISSEGTSTYSHLFNNFVKQQGKQLDATTPFELGVSLDKKEVEKKKNIGFESRKFEVNYVVSSHWKKRLVAHKTLNIEVKTAQIKGLLIHEILAKIYHAEMLDQLLEETFERNIKAKEYQLFITKKVKEVISHPMISSYFERDQQVLCEQDVLVPKGPTLRPDRVNLLSDGSAIIIDYKTGVPKEADGRQIDAYEKIYQDLGYSPIEKFLVYINEEVLVEKRKI